MNDFTKEELNDIMDWADAYTSYECGDIYKTHEKLIVKLQSMIDNYCEHECHHKWDGVLLTSKPTTGKCNKCGIVCYIAIKDK